MSSFVVANDSTADNERIREAYPLDVYCIVSAGPDEKDDSDLGTYPYSAALAYDPTNGSVSAGDLYRCGPGDRTPLGWKPPYEYVLGDPPY